MSCKLCSRVCFAHWRPAFGSCKCALLYVCAMYALLTDDLLSGLVSVLCYMFVSCSYALLTGDLLSGLVSVLCCIILSFMICSLAICFQALYVHFETSE